MWAFPRPCATLRKSLTWLNSLSSLFYIKFYIKFIPYCGFFVGKTTWSLIICCTSVFVKHAGFSREMPRFFGSNQEHPGILLQVNSNHLLEHLVFFGMSGSELNPAMTLFMLPSETIIVIRAMIWKIFLLMIYFPFLQFFLLCQILVNILLKK